jgi:hypothetical protein
MAVDQAYRHSPENQFEPWKGKAGPPKKIIIAGGLPWQPRLGPILLIYNSPHIKPRLRCRVFPGQIFGYSQSPEDPDAQFLLERRVIAKLAQARGNRLSRVNRQFSKARGLEPLVLQPGRHQAVALPLPV